MHLRISYATRVSFLYFTSLVLVGFVSYVSGYIFWLFSIVALYFLFLANMKGVVSFQTRVSVGFLSCFFALLLTLWLPTITSPDSVAFLSNFQTYTSIELIGEIFASISDKGLGFISTRLTFPLFLKAFLGDIFIEYPALILTINIALWTCASLLWVSVLKERYERLYPHSSMAKKTPKLVFVFLMLSPSVLYWEIALNKDIASVSLSIFAFYFLVRKNWLLFILFFLVASMIRPYSAAVIASYYIYYKNNRTLMLSATAGVMLMLIMLSKGSFTVIINGFLGLIFFLVSPNPLSPSNWQISIDTGTWQMSPILLTLEGIFVLFILAIGMALILNRRNLRIEFVATIFSIFIVSSAVVFVGYYRVLDIGLDYGLGTFGDNLVRKKLSAWPLIITLIASIVSHFSLGSLKYARR